MGEHQVFYLTGRERLPEVARGKCESLCAIETEVKEVMGVMEARGAREANP